MEQLIQSESLTFWTENFGDPKNPALILIMGVAGQGIMWSDSFCQELSKEYFVIRYDHRDVGQSSHINYMVNPYGLRDLADDVIRILDGYNIQQAHLVGTSMGGYLAQLCMQRSPERISSVTLIMSTIDFSPMGKAMVGNLAANDLPPPDKEMLDGLKAIGAIDTSDYDSWLFKSLKILRLFNGTEVPFDEAEWVPVLEKAYLRRNTDMPPNIMHNHVMACSQGPMCYYDVKPACPVHVIHGSADSMLPVAHAKRTATHYNATLTIIKGMGHARPKVFEHELVTAMQQFFGQLLQAC
jgi:pimeloyl-ACP methyl ester carboxylesterase